MDVLTPDHERWDEFVELLFGETGINLRDSSDGSEWFCPHDSSFPVSERLLREMGGVDVEETLVRLTARGDLCDCEVAFNSDR